MHASESSTPIADRPARAGAASVAVVLLAAVTACVPLRRVTVDVPVTLAPNATATASLPGPANYVDRAARVRLRFADAPLRSRGGASWNYTVDFTVTPLINGAPAGTPQASSLTVYRGMDRESFESLALVAPLSADGVQVAVTAINSVDPTALPADLKLNLELSGVRAVEFARKKKPSISLLNGPTLGVVMTSIPDGTVSYEFEWVFYDRQETKPAEPFANRDPVRIASATPLTLIDTSYPDGALYVRARAIGRHGTAMAESAARRTGQWSNVLRIPLTPGGLEPESNWKYTAAYAEDLGLASGIEYFDGAYRSRQRQSRALTQDARVVAETKYDGEGRPVLTFLPAPTDGTRLTHADAFNTVDTPGGATPTGAYGTAQFEGGPPAPASTTSGAGQYYSGSASIRAPTDAYVADARGYPYSIVERARDNSGRQRRRSGTGEPLRLGGGHEALVRYGTASSSALRRLFGANVGQAAYYDRNVVIDPNRRAEVNYVDRSGNVIASAVAGTTNSLESIAPANLPLLTYRLDENNIVDAHAGVSRSVNRISVEYGTDLFFSYDVNGAQYTVPASGPFPRLCESCRYRLRVRITGPSGDLVSVRESATPQSDPSCDSAPLRSEIARDVGDTAPPPNFCTAGAAHSAVTATSPTQTQVRFCAKFTEPGEYEVVKELTLIDGAVEAIVNTVFSTPGTFDINTFRPDATIIDRQCPGDCAAFCSNVDTEHRQQCVASCRQPLDWAISAVANESCKSLEEEIKADVGPRGILKATALIDHPEYCHIFKASPVTPSLCQRTIASNVFDYRMMSVHTWNEALCRGYLDPLQGTPGAPARPATCPGLPERDPITDPTQIGVSMRGWMIAALQDYTGNMPGFSTLPTQQPPPAPPPPAQPHLSIWQAATLPIYPSTSPPSDDERWRMFRSLYIGVKQTAIVKYMEDPNGGNCPYWNDRHAHVKRPYTFTTTQDAQDTAAGERDYYCASLCNSRAAQWIADLETECEVTIPGFYKSQRLAPGLREYHTKSLPQTSNSRFRHFPSQVAACRTTTCNRI